MVDRLIKAAQEGDIEALYESIKNDKFILENLDSIPFLQSPLHIAALFGKTHFALAFMTLKPSFARKHNQDGHTPMHLAAANSDEQLIRGFLLRDKELVRLNGHDGYTPLHIMVIVGGNPIVLRDVLSACPDSILDVTGKRETVLHLAVKNNRFESFYVLIEFIKTYHKEELFARRDEEGYTALHYATKYCHIEMLRLLFLRYAFQEWDIAVDSLDINGRTALDLVIEMPSDHEYKEEMRDLLARGTLEGIVTREEGAGRVISNRFWGYVLHQLSIGVQKLPPHIRSAFLIVLVLVNNTTLLVGLTPPGGFWQDDGDDVNDPHAGKPILRSENGGLYILVAVLTSMGFISSLNWIFLLTMRMPMRFLLLVAVSFLSYSYLWGLVALTGQMSLLTMLYGGVFLVFTILMGVYMWVYMKLPSLSWWKF